MALQPLGWRAALTWVVPGRSSSVLHHRLTAPSQSPPRLLPSCNTLKPTRQGRLTVTSAWNVSYGVQSSGTRVVVRVGQTPP
jgi:hypothetical protein